MKPYLFLFILCFAGFTPNIAAPPDWPLTPSDYENQANMVARLEVDTELDNNPDNIIGFFVGTEVRATATPITVGDNEQYYFITIYSNVSADETMEIKAYLADNDAVYTVNESYQFVKSRLDGSVDEPFIITLSTDGDLPISLTTVHEQITLQNYAFSDIVLDDILIQQDNDPIQWTYQAGGNLVGNVNQGVFEVQAFDPEWTGSEIMTLTATEISSNQYTASIDIVYTVLEDYAGPAWGTIPGETIAPEETFTPFNLNDYENEFEGDCMNFSWKPVLEIPDIWSTSPDWSVHPPDYQYTMTITARVNFSDNYYFVGEDDKLGAFMDGEERGVAEVILVDGEPYYFLTVYSSTGGDITLKLYSSEFRNIYTIPSRIPFQANGSLGTPDVPQILNAAPLTIDINAFGEVQVIILEPTWRGEQAFEFTAADCDLPALKNDVTFATFAVTDGSLPIEWLSFDGKSQEDIILLNWAMNSTESIQGFHIQRSESLDGRDWKTIGFVPYPTGHTTKHFLFKDENPLMGNNYYRLKIVDWNQEEQFSNTISVQHKKQSLNIFPNPTTSDELFLEFWTAQEGTATFQIYNKLGQLEQTFDYELQQGNNLIALPIHSLSSGVYTLSGHVAGKSLIELFLKN